ncbi:THAP domain-containing protein 1-like [Onychostoma macrolepis]|uniref:THAP domain-containing protein 1-like n=1 Tax=Onychostoma macrolepis TaxID=369639 RepID=UPI00272DC1E3|nr:THAP domain-containing protein 1-like [Onychostoma macrolepis]
MAPHCCVPQCTSSHRKKSNRGQTFHRFPKDQGLRRQWIINIRRDPGRNFKINTYTKVCSEHFLPDCLVKSKTGITKLKQGAVPTVFAWSSVRPERRSVVRTASNVSTDLDDRHGVNVLSEETPPPHPDHEYAALPPSLQDQFEEARKTIGDQELLILELQQKQFLISNFQGDDKQISFYTGFPDYDTFKAVFMALQPTAENMVGWSQAQRLKHTSGEVLRQGFSASKLSTMDQFFLFLCRLRQGFPEQDLATRFHVSQ